MTESSNTNETPTAPAAIPVGETPETVASVGAARAKLEGMIGRKLPAIPDSSRPTSRPVAAPVDAKESERKSITAKLIMEKDLKPEERENLTRRLRALTGHEMATKEEATARENQSLEEARQEYGMSAPEHFSPDMVKEYDASYGQFYEPALYDVARAAGLDGAMVASLRDAAVSFGEVISDRGTPATEIELKAIFDKIRVPTHARAELTKLYRLLEGQP